MLLKLLMAACLLAYSTANIVKRAAGVDDCYRCSTWDALGQGFIEASDNPPMCGHYKECWKAKNTGVIVELDRWCPPGTWTDPEDIRRGAPCTSTVCPIGCLDCDIPTASTPMWYPCPYVQMSPEWTFGMWRGALLEQVGTCGDGGYFNDTNDVCTCTVMTVDCTCKVSIPLTADIDTHGCNGGWVGQLGMPAMVLVSGGMGQFKGFQPLLDNGDHIGTYVIDGAFAGAWVHQLKFTADFCIDQSFDNVPIGTRWGIVTYGDCAAGYSFGFYIERTGATTWTLHAALELQDGPLTDYVLSTTVTPGNCYFASAVYVEDAPLPGDNFVLWFSTLSDYNSCLGGNPANCPVIVDGLRVVGTITPRGCGFVIGHTSTDNNDEFFIGQIGWVSVDIHPGTLDNYFPCH